tara:strand:+ start:260 stop:475 length:216 start_codon:yes stop_codon:yes gene_type:complete
MSGMVLLAALVLICWLGQRWLPRKASSWPYRPLMDLRDESASTLLPAPRTLPAPRNLPGVRGGAGGALFEA